MVVASDFFFFKCRELWWKEWICWKKASLLKIINIECQVENNEYFRHLLLFTLNQGSKAAKAVRNICAVYGEDPQLEITAPDGYAKFRNGNFNLKNVPCSGRPVEFDEEQ
ncbi:histone-lysine N-methyltransferase SETMAR-like protein [Nephila pilipes]|uniref:Histone-lysine N-methyltransferase SETMAR-like protein n=1 Tax=Nephila pilipes TaxID=299642 RepID=A0A8X6Q523_NEPPI|nr:histone-lysine N-methyltransferase SETMAR-like protein [Nephila pilipes]